MGVTQVDFKCIWMLRPSAYVHVANAVAALDTVQVMLKKDASQPNMPFCFVSWKVWTLQAWALGFEAGSSVHT